MPEFVRWFDRAFAFDLEPFLFPNVVERLLDSSFFVAEHDDHHLAWITRLKR